MSSPDIASIADRLALMQLTHDYCWALDTGDWEALRNIFTPDVVADLGAGGQAGVDEVIERVSSALSVFDASHHNVSTHQVTIDGDTATGRCYLIAQHINGAGKFLYGGAYHDTFIRTSDGWRIATRRIENIWTDGDPPAMGGR